MRLEDFRSLVDRLARDVPREYRDGIVAIDVSPKTIPHPLHADIYTLGECIPLEWSGDGSDLQSRVVLYHGSFQALARHGDLDWREEAWETLTHELRHHLEWRAKEAALEAYDTAAEHNFARHEGKEFDPTFYRSGEELAPEVYKVDDDVFVEGGVGSPKGRGGERSAPVILWHGRTYRVPLPETIRPPAFIVLQGLDEPPPGDAVLVLARRASLLGIFRRPVVTQAVVQVQRIDA